ncbi:hypothetical protein [Azonexus hydrophilus]|uniref:hypothetical protein n=1 Tax=Azonexus hydrophilus TaxID=418702 RepID=UPI002490D33F|nr:hypothetical protein [Azonexus hydrophilus]
MFAERKRVLILCKTYPSPSTTYVETSCVAGMDDKGKLIRLFPVPFRLVSDDQQFKKWQWIEARVRKAKEDNRPESHRISVDTIELLGERLSLRNEWAERRQAISPVEIFNSFTELDAARENLGTTLGLLRPKQLIDLLITKADSPDWSPDETAKLMQAQTQGSLFDQDTEQKSLTLLKKLPFDFHYLYACESNGVITTHKHKLVDWEAGALFWNVHRKPDWQALFRQKYLTEFSTKDLLFLMGTIHRFPGQWLIVGVIYPPKPRAAQAGQGQLF